MIKIREDTNFGNIKRSSPPLQSSLFELYKLVASALAGQAAVKIDSKTYVWHNKYNGLMVQGASD